MESPKSVFVALGFATVASLVIGVPATYAFGLKGAIWGSNAADVLSLAALMFMLRQKLATVDPADHSSRSSRLATDVRPAMALEVPEEI
jgi:hypothetical protein